MCRVFVEYVYMYMYVYSVCIYRYKHIHSYMCLFKYICIYVSLSRFRSTFFFKKSSKRLLHKFLKKKCEVDFNIIALMKLKKKLKKNRSDNFINFKTKLKQNTKRLPHKL